MGARRGLKGGGTPGGLTSNGTNITNLAFPAGIGTWATVAPNAGGAGIPIFGGGTNTNGQDTWVIGDPTNLPNLRLVSAATTFVRGAAVTLQPANGSADWLKVASTGIIFGLGIGGDGTAGTPWKLLSSSIAVAGAAITLSSAQIATPFIILTGAPGADRTVIGPTVLGARYVVLNQTGTAQTFKTLAGTGFLCPASLTAASVVICDGANYVSGG